MAEALASTLIDPALQERLAPVLEVRAPQIDAGELPAQSTLTLLAAEGLLPRVEWDSPAVPAPLDLQRAGELLATVAWSDLASAFSLWCHVMTMLYLAYADRGSLLRVEFLPQLERAERWGVPHWRRLSAMPRQGVRCQCGRGGSRNMSSSCTVSSPGRRT